MKMKPENDNLENTYLAAGEAAGIRISLIRRLPTP